MTDFTRTSDAYDKYAKALREAALINKSAVFDALSSAAITHVRVDFDGEGDSGYPLPQSRWMRIVPGDASIKACRRASRRLERRSNAADSLAVISFRCSGRCTIAASY
jgi:hypothetical protein